MNGDAEWLSAADTISLLADGKHANVAAAASAVLRRSGAGILRAKAFLIAGVGSTGAELEVPASYWRDLGDPDRCTYDWLTGDFSFAGQGRSFKLLSVQFSADAVREMKPPDRSYIPEDRGGWYTARDAIALIATKAEADLVRKAQNTIIQRLKIGLIKGRADFVRSPSPSSPLLEQALLEPGDWDILTRPSSSNSDWSRGDFWGRIPQTLRGARAGQRATLHAYGVRFDKEGVERLAPQRPEPPRARRVGEFASWVADRASTDNRLTVAWKEFQAIREQTGMSHISRSKFESEWKKHHPVLKRGPKSSG